MSRGINDATMVRSALFQPLDDWPPGHRPSQRGHAYLPDPVLLWLLCDPPQLADHRRVSWLRRPPNI